MHIGARVSAWQAERRARFQYAVDLVIGSGLEFEDRGADELKGVPGSGIFRRRLYTAGGFGKTYFACG